MEKNIQKIISIMVIFCLIFQSIPVYALETISDKIFAKIEPTIHKDEKKREVAYEITSKREENKKYFKMTDGTEKVNLYSTDVHFKENGKYVDINNKLTLKDDVYENKKAPYKVKYKNEINEGNILEIEKDDYNLSISIKDGNKVKATIPKDNSKIDSNITASSEELIPNLSSSIEYKEIKKDVDFKYVTLPNKIKESIILNDKDAEKTFKYEIKLNKSLEANIVDHNIIEFKDDDNIVFSIETPYMYDSELNLSTDIEIKLEKKEYGYDLTVIPDSEWLSDKNRKYPVTIDPTITTSQIRNQIEDAFIFEGDENIDPVAKANQHILRVGSNRFSGTKQNPTRSLIKFTLPNLNSGDQVIDAQLGLFSYACSLEPGISCPAGKPIEISVHKLTRSWDKWTANWAWMGAEESYDHKAADYQTFNFDWNDQIKGYSFDITSIVKDWYISGQNNGLVLKETNEVKNLNREDAYFFSSDVSDQYASGRPFVSITYRNQSGLENYQTFSEHTIGNLDVAINNYNGNFVLTYEGASTPGNRLPVNINHVYNTNDKNTNIGYGKGFRLNLNQVIEQDGENLKYTDEDGTKHWFKKEENKYVDEDGLDLSIYVDGDNYRMEDKSGNSSIFIKRNNIWHLSEVRDNSNNKIIISLDANDYNKINKVTDGAGDEIDLIYKDNLLEKIVDSNNREFKFIYSNNNLIKIILPDNTTNELFYNNDLITKIIAPEGNYNTYEYYSNSPFKLKKINEFGKNNDPGNSLEFKYSENTTSITEASGRTTNYLFNDYGNTTSITDLDGQNSVQDAYGQVYTFETDNEKGKNRLKSEGNLIKNTNNLISNGDAEEDLNGWEILTDGVGTITIDNINKYQGSKSFKISSNKLSNQTPNLFQRVNLKSNTTYTISAWVKGNITEQNNGGLYFSAKYRYGEGDSNKQSSEPKKISKDWQRYSFTFSLPENPANIDLAIGVTNAKGTISIDNIQLEESSVMNSYNLVKNSDFNNDLSYWKRLQVTDSNDKVVDDNGNKVVMINGVTDNTKAFQQEIKVSGKKGDSFNLSFFAKTIGVPNKDNRKMGMAIAFSDENGNWLSLDYYLVEPDNINWQFKNENIIAPADYSKIYIALISEYQIGQVYYDNIGLYKDEQINSYTYDGKGNIINTKDSTGQNNNYTYDDDNQLILSKNNRNRTTLYSYDNEHKHRLLSTISPDGIRTNYDYDEYGNKTSTKTLSKKIINLNSIDPEQEYYIKAYNTELYIMPNGSIEENGTKLYLNELSNNGDDRWRFEKTTNGKYVIKSVSSKNETVFDIDGGNTNDGTSIQLWKNEGNEHANQTFEIDENDDGSFTFKSKVTNYSKCIDVENGNFAKETRIQQYSCNNTASQKFFLIPIKDSDEDIGEKVKNISQVNNEKIYYIKNISNNLFMSALNSVDENTSQIVLNPISDNGFAEWKLIKVNGNKYEISPANTKTNMTLDVAGGNQNDWASIQLWTAQHNEHSNQTFEIVDNGDGTFTFKTKLTNYTKCIDVKDVKFVKNNSLQQYACSDNNIAQKFIIYEKNESDQKYIETSSTYDEKGKYQISSTDERGKTANTIYNDETGTIASTTDPNGYTTNYEYDIMNNTTKISNGNTVNSYTYENNNLKTISHNGITYTFNYDNFGNITETKVGNQTLVNDTYDKISGNLIKSVYGNGHEINYEYDNFDRIKSREESNRIINYSYDNRGNLSKIQTNDFTKNYIYDLSGRLSEENQDDKFITKFSYDKYNNLNSINYTLGDTTNILNYTYDIDNKLTQLNNIKYNYDKLNRISSKVINDKYKIKYSFENIGENKTTTNIKTIQNGNDKLEYDYDNNGNIISIKQNSKVLNEYEYDNLNQLVKEHDNNQKQTILYTYDTGGNILSKKIYEYKTDTLIKEINYSYNNDNWKDQLTNYNGNQITYDEIGNPLSYGNNISFTWQNGRELASYKDDDKEITYKYDENGIRTEKKVNNETYKYYLNDTDIIFEETPEGTIYYTYDTTGLVSFSYKNKEYYYIKNLQNDIIGLLDEDFNVIANYAYDSWGKIISITDKEGKEITDENHVANINPFRYRSYYYDKETGLYYLNSRYYNPEIGRFINADGILGANADEISYNLYAYVSNNPINLTDNGGEFAIAGSLLAVAGAILKATIYTMAIISAVSLATDVSKSVSSSKDEENKSDNNYYVYTLSSNNTVLYVGRTNDPKRRGREHRRIEARAQLELNVEAENLTKKQARGIEQGLIMKYRTLNRNNPAANQINGIRWDNKRCSEYMNAAFEVFPDMADDREVYVGYCKY